MVLPTFGVKEKAAIEGISLGDAERNVPYEIKYSAHHLWLMEE
jgi:hypothetical protein